VNVFIFEYDNLYAHHAILLQSVPRAVRALRLSLAKLPHQAIAGSRPIQGTRHRQKHTSRSTHEEAPRITGRGHPHAFVELPRSQRAGRVRGGVRPRGLENCTGGSAMTVIVS
jgi:hypothetical protein